MPLSADGGARATLDLQGIIPPSSSAQLHIPMNDDPQPSVQSRAIVRYDEGRASRAQVLRAIVQSDEVSLNREATNAFVAAQYYGYLRRTPDTAEFNSWINYLTAHPGDFRTMVNGFLNSSEYRLRFGPAQ